jgi:hypothetical protein
MPQIHIGPFSTYFTSASPAAHHQHVVVGGHAAALHHHKAALRFPTVGFQYSGRWAQRPVQVRVDSGQASIKFRF